MCINCVCVYIYIFTSICIDIYVPYCTVLYCNVLYGNVFLLHCIVFVLYHVSM